MAFHGINLPKCIHFIVEIPGNTFQFLAVMNMLTKMLAHVHLGHVCMYFCRVYAREWTCWVTGYVYLPFYKIMPNV